MNWRRSRINLKANCVDRNIQLMAYAAVVLVLCTIQSYASPRNVQPSEQDVSVNRLLLSLGSKIFDWEQPTDPIKIAGSLHFVGTKGLGVFLLTTSDGHILLNTGMPSSAPMIVRSIRKLGFKPEDIKIMINSHAHIDHAGAFSYFKEQFNAQMFVMREDVSAMESGGRNDFRYGNDLAYPMVKVDRVLDHGDTVKLGNVELIAYHTPGHTRGATTWVTRIEENGRTYLVAFPDGAGFNRGYRLAKNPSYSRINDDFRNTHHFLEMLKPDIWLTPHNNHYEFAGKRRRALKEGVGAWIDPEGYRRFIARKKREFEKQVDAEME